MSAEVLNPKICCVGCKARSEVPMVTLHCGWSWCSFTVAYPQASTDPRSPKMATGSLHDHLLRHLSGELAEEVHGFDDPMEIAEERDAASPCPTCGGEREWSNGSIRALLCARCEIARDQTYRASST